MMISSSRNAGGGYPKLEARYGGQGEAIQRALLAGKGSHADQLLQVADEFLRC